MFVFFFVFSPDSMSNEADNPVFDGIYDFCGGLLPTLGGGSWWDTPTVIVTAVLAVAVTAWMLILLFRTGPDEIRWMKPKGEKNNDGYDSD